LQIKGNNLPFRTHGFGQNMGVLARTSGQINSQVAMFKDFAEELLTPDDDAG
jgi:hypothetical protein